MVLCCISRNERGILLKDVSFHRFPKNPVRRKCWVDTIQEKIKNFTCTENSLICSDHFTVDCFIITGTGKKYLKPDAKPSLFMTLKKQYHLQDEVQTSDRSEQTPMEHASVTISTSHCNEPVPEEVIPSTSKNTVKRLTRFGCVGSENINIQNEIEEDDMKHANDEIVKLRKKVKVYQQKCRRLEKKVTSLTSLITHLRERNLLSPDTASLLHNSLSEVEKEMIKRCLNKKTKVAFPPEIKTFAATLQFYSTKAYEYVRKTFLNVLPHPQTIRRWYTSVDAKPGITKEALRTIEEKIQEAALSDKKLYFSLVVDDMSIREFVEIVGDQYYGFVDYGIDANNGDNMPEAKHACVFLVVCINGSWKIPVAYFLISSLSGIERANLIKLVLTSLHETGAIIVNITMDGCASNIATMQSLGAIISPFNIKPYFIEPIRKEKIYVILDACHMLKLIRNAFATCNNMHDAQGNKIEWRYIVHLLQTQEQEGLHAATKLTKRHLNWQQEKMNVKIAAQTLSTSVANAIDFCRCDLGIPQFSGSEATTVFIRL